MATRRRREKCEAPALASASRRMMNALARRAADGEAEAVEALVALQADLDAALAAAVEGYRVGPAEASWADVATLTGTTRQAAFARFSRKAAVL